MSSLAASQADGFYFPPEYLDNEVNKKMGLSKYQGSKGANQYQQKGIIRFELPFDAWCLKCKRHMSKGTRYNAKKDKCGNYFSTTIFSFTTKCASCDNQFVIKTDPQNNTYDYAEGLRKHEQDFEPEFGDGIIETSSTETRIKLQEDPIFKLQHDKEDKERAMTAKTRLDDLMDLSDQVNRPDYDRNAALRNANRSHRKRKKELSEEGAKLGLSIPLVEPCEDDIAAARAITFKSTVGVNSEFEISHRKKVVDIKSQSIFSSEAADLGASKRHRINTVTGSISSSASRKNDKLKAAISKQAVHKISMKNVRLATTRVGSSSVRSSGSGSGPSYPSVTLKQVSKKKSINDTKIPSADVRGSTSNNPEVSGALTLLSGLYDSDDD